MKDDPLFECNICCKSGRARINRNTYYKLQVRMLSAALAGPKILSLYCGSSAPLTVKTRYSTLPKRHIRGRREMLFQHHRKRPLLAGRQGNDQTERSK